MDYLRFRQAENETTGELNQTGKFLNKHYWITFILFVLVVVAAQLWTALTISIAGRLFGVKRDELTTWMWFIVASVASIFVYIFVRFIIKVPLTTIFKFPW